MDIQQLISDPRISIAAAAVLFVLFLVAWLRGRKRKKRIILQADKSIGRTALSSISIELDDVESEVSLRERLLSADFGPKGIDALVAHLQQELDEDDFQQPKTVLRAIQQYYIRVLKDVKPLELADSSPTVWLMAGVNGSGKTTTTAKLAAKYHAQGKTVVVGACDTFRAAASEQLEQWGQRIGFRVVTGGERTDPGSVAYNTIESAKAKDADLVILDTAGRLHVDDNLMRELEKVHRTAGKALGRPVDESLLVLDVNQGQNIRSQLERFGAVIPLTGLAFTKYDGLGRGGAAIDSLEASGLPVRCIGVGEGETDLIDPSAEWLVEKIFGPLI